jgi:hypothetical protein
MKMYQVLDAELHEFLTSVLDGTQRLVSSAERFIPGRKPLVPNG